MSITKTARTLCYVALLFAARFPAEAQNYFTDAEVDTAKGSCTLASPAQT